MEKKNDHGGETPAKDQSSEVRTPEEGEFTIQNKFLKNILNMHAGPSYSPNTIENDPDFIY